MENEEKAVLEEASKEETIVDEDEFVDSKVADEEAAAPIEAKEEALEESKAEDEVPTIAEKMPEAPKPRAESYEYEDPRLEAVETFRKGFLADYKKHSRIKNLVSVVVVAAIVAAWIPAIMASQNSDPEHPNNLPFLIALGIAAVAIIGLGVYSHFMKKKVDLMLKTYFNNYYGNVNEFLFDGLDVHNVSGDVDSKISKDEFIEADIYPDVYSVGSRDFVTFTYEGLDFGMADAACQCKGNKALATAFVGKYINCPNSFNGDKLVIYFKGNARALPPKSLPELRKAGSGKGYVIYGSERDAKYIDENVRNILSSIVTDELLVDLCIVIRPGKTQMFVGYEDTLMILPLQNAFDPLPNTKAKEHLKTFLALGKALS